VFKNIAHNFFETAGFNFYWRKQVSSSPLQNLTKYVLCLLAEVLNHLWYILNTKEIVNFELDVIFKAYSKF